MDIVLGVSDTLLWDRMYATLVPRPEYAAAGLQGLLNTTLPLGPPIEVDQVSQYFDLQPTLLAYASRLPRDHAVRQLFTLFLITWLFGAIIYFTMATLSYVFVFDKLTFQHPKYLKNQMRDEIIQTMFSLPAMAVLTAPLFLLEVRGYSKLYMDVDWDSKASVAWMVLQFPVFLMFTDLCIYWIHRGLHHPRVYKQLHKPHHKWIMPTPYASHAFHPLDGYAQGLPYHIFPFLLPLHKISYLVLFTFINVWTVMIHDGEYVANSPIINGAACHTMHHLYFNYNYGQFTTLWDRLGGSYRKPNMELFYKETKMSQAEWKKQSEEMEKVAKEVEGEDKDGFRKYAAADKKHQ